MKPVGKLLIIALFLLCAVSLFADGTLQIISEDPELDWEISIDEQRLSFEQGMTVWLSPGLHRLQAFIQGYQMIDEPVRIEQGERTEVLLQLEEPSVRTKSSIQVINAASRSGLVVVTAVSADTAFSFNGIAALAPAEIPAAAGNYTIHSGNRSWDVEVLEGEALVVQVDPDLRKIKSFSVTLDTYDSLKSTRSYEDVFTVGFRRYGSRDFWTLRNTLIVLAAFVLLVIYLIWRTSLQGRVHVALWKKRSKARRVKSLSKKDPKGKMSEHARALQKRIDNLDSLERLLMRKISAEKEHFEKLKDNQTPKGLKRRQASAKRLKRLIRMRKRIETVKG